MSNLSDIGFPTSGEKDINDMISHVLELTETIRCPQGFYLKFADASGAEIWLQGNFEQELLGFNPHFAGKSRRRVGLTKAIERESSPLDGGFYAWANPADENVETSGEYPFIFDVPDFHLNQISQFPHLCEIQLTALASNDFKVFADEKEYAASQSGELKYASKSFAPNGLLEFDAADESVDLSAVRPIGTLSGEIKEFELRTNQLSGEKFYWFLIDTFGGEIDVAADVKLISNEPKIGGIVSGQFWLSGRIGSADGSSA
ncbi:MAG: hypothetical protein LH614_00920 [Pyrinomonadaceae bacterium]|nr:hypothetical protein [Pyrinomonadaceae bacterium]